jgi:inositol-1,4,5-trisphosphate 5-phosphatase
MWDNIIDTHLNKLGSKYTKVHSKDAKGLYISMHVKEDIKELVTSIESKKVKTSSANKIGSILISFKIGDTIFYMMNCQLSNGKGDYQKQFNEMRVIYYSAARKSPEDIPQPKEAKFLFGDLNFSLELDKSSATIMVKQERFEEMREFDQLWTQYNNFRYLPALIEEELKFEPTYKYFKGTSEFDLNTVPGWRDRILWSKADYINCEKYDSSNTITFSEHKPICGIYQVQVNIKKEADTDESLGFEEVGAKSSTVNGEEIKLSFKPKLTINPSRNNDILTSKGNEESKNITSSIDTERKGSYDMIKDSGK